METREGVRPTLTWGQQPAEWAIDPQDGKLTWAPRRQLVGVKRNARLTDWERLESEW